MVYPVYTKSMNIDLIFSKIEFYFLLCLGLDIVCNLDLVPLDYIHFIFWFW